MVLACTSQVDAQWNVPHFIAICSAFDHFIDFLVSEQLQNKWQIIGV